MNKSLQPRDAAARIQRVFRGWRTRRRVVHQVREDLELLVDDIRRQLGGDWALLLGPATAAPPFSLDWGRDATLRLPRMEDALFGVPVLFPIVETADHHEGVTAASADEQEPSGLGDCELESEPPVDESAADQVGGEQDVAAHETSSETSGRDAPVSAVEIRGTPPQAETSATDSVGGLERQADNMAGQRAKDGDGQLAGIQEILATHTRAEIVLELEWARKSLRDRRKYLRSKRRVERGPDPLACA